MTTLTAVPDMAKKQAKKAVEQPVEPPASEERVRKPMIVQIRGSEEWKGWVEAIADKEGDSLAKLFERAVRKFARDGGYPDPPRR